VTLHLFRRAGGPLIQTSNPTADPVEYSTQGGGWAQRMSNANFHRHYKPTTAKGMKPVLVSGDWDEDEVGVRRLWPAYCDEQRWNGWAIPYFEIKVALALVQTHPDLITYDPATNWFRILDQGLDESYEVSPTMIEINGKFIETFQLVDGWCWDVWR
jgi:hypothetical protein